MGDGQRWRETLTDVVKASALTTQAALICDSGASTCNSAAHRRPHLKVKQAELEYGLEKFGELNKLPLLSL